MVRITRTIEIVSDDLTLNEDTELPNKLEGVLMFEIPDVDDKECVVDLKIGSTHLGWLTKESAIELAQSIIQNITPLLEKEAAPVEQSSS